MNIAFFSFDVFVFEFQKKIYSKTRSDGHITMCEKSVLTTVQEFKELTFRALALRYPDEGLKRNCATCEQAPA